MSGTADLDVLKDIPGYKAILKSVLKTQIQMLVEQLAQHTEEESIILTASVNDGTLSHLGSCTGKGFLEGRDEIKSQFLGYCLKSHHRKKTQEAPPKPSPHPRVGLPQPSPRPSVSHPVPAKRPRIHPVSLTRVGQGPGDDTSPGVSRNINSPSHRLSTSGVSLGKIEAASDIDESNNFNGSSLAMPSTSTPVSFQSSLQPSHTQTSGDTFTDLQQQHVGQSEDKKPVNISIPAAGDHDSNSGSTSGIKIEPITEGDMELEITGVELGNLSQPSGGEWGSNLTGDQMGYTSAEGDDSLSQQGGDQSGYTNRLLASDLGRDYQGKEQFNFKDNLNLVKFESLSEFAVESTANENSSDLFKKYYSITNARISATPNESEILNKSIQYNCKWCDKICRDNVDLKRHEKTHTGDVHVYSCPWCNKPCRDSCDLQRHERTHTGAKPFTCEVCSRAFSRRDHMKKHLFNVHRIIPDVDVKPDNGGNVVKQCP